ncbi:MAG: recombination protein RecR [Candidatus Hydrogenedentota bacterium]|nr:MAG: recombination protein RecR [Candidatus Hydrogenedentota bacterium]
MLPELDEFLKELSELPGMGRKSAQRIAFYFLRQSEEKVNRFEQALKNFYQNITTCGECGALKSTREHCEFCQGNRDKSILCVVEQASDIFAIENAGEFHGLYHVLQGVLSPLDGIGPSDIRLAELKARVDKLPGLEEIIVATNPSLEGNATANYIASMLKEKPIVISRIASGLALGSQLDYADSKIISESIRERRKIEV